MKAIYRKAGIISIMIVAFALFFAGGGDICKDINQIISSGNAQQLSKYLNSTVEMSILGNEGYFSKAQASAILEDFFSKNKPTSFVPKQGGSDSENTKFSTGTYTSAHGTYKIYYVVKTVQNTALIHKITIEKK
ncbi:MAG: DUF4783 domain-containing protein [Bacteroidales bacterium]|jgi:hypothetical protein|nr:DUF4783 domain-containing protein [Bacteroidales bacterium]